MKENSSLKPIPSLSLAAIPTERVFHELFNDKYILNIYLQEIFVRVVGMKNGDKIYNTGNLFVNRN